MRCEGCLRPGGLDPFDHSRYIGASLTMIDCHYGHLARDGREHAIQLLDALNVPGSAPWTLREPPLSTVT
jgi:hypothetical protein